jgi:uncharacterized membrane protein YgcG
VKAALKLLLVLWYAGHCPWLSAADKTAIPYLSGRVVDQAEILSAAARGRIGSLLQAHEKATGNQIAVLTVNGIGAESIWEAPERITGC